MTYKIEEVVEIIEQTKFATNYKLEKITLSNLPIWISIMLIKK